jgi:sugar transferase EpsL
MPVSLFPQGIPISKRLFDLVLTIPALILLSPILLILSVLVWIFEGWPVVFHQERPGLNGQIFTIYKFRTMRELRGKTGDLLPDSQRLSRLGLFLRNSSLDELPEFFNVLRGEMSLVGPRPLLVQYLARYNPEQARRHLVMPGITGWAQVHGRNAITWPEKFRLDVWYVDHWSLWLDARILLLTVWKAVKREGISQPGFSTAEEFLGNETEETGKDY